MWCGMATHPLCLLGQTLRKHRWTTTAFLTCHNLVRAAMWLLQQAAVYPQSIHEKQNAQNFPQKCLGKTTDQG